MKHGPRAAFLPIASSADRVLEGSDSRKLLPQVLNKDVIAVLAKVNEVVSTLRWIALACSVQSFRFEQAR